MSGICPDKRESASKQEGARGCVKCVTETQIWAGASKVATPASAGDGLKVSDLATDDSFSQYHLRKGEQRGERS